VQPRVAPVSVQLIDIKDPAALSTSAPNDPDTIYAGRSWRRAGGIRRGSTPSTMRALAVPSCSIVTLTQSPALNGA
jgi:hypothetical protein